MLLLLVVVLLVLLLLLLLLLLPDGSLCEMVQWGLRVCALTR